MFPIRFYYTVIADPLVADSTFTDVADSGGCSVLVNSAMIADLNPKMHVGLRQSIVSIPQHKHRKAGADTDYWRVQALP